MDKLFVVMPAYNEQDNIEEVVKSWYKTVDKIVGDFKLIVADGGSTDNTHAILVDLARQYPKLKIISDTAKSHGAKVIALYKYAINENVQYIFQTDSDGQTNPCEFYEFWKLRDSYDGVIGKRLVREDGGVRSFVEKIVCLLLYLFFGIKVPDANAPFRLMKTSIVKKYIDRMADDYELPNIMLVTFFSYYGENITFKEISFKNRQKGENSVDINKIVRIGLKSLGDFWHFRKGMV